MQKATRCQQNRISTLLTGAIHASIWSLACMLIFTISPHVSACSAPQGKHFNCQQLKRVPHVLSLAPCRSAVARLSSRRASSSSSRRWCTRSRCNMVLAPLRTWWHLGPMLGRLVLRWGQRAGRRARCSHMQPGAVGLAPCCPSRVMECHQAQAPT